MLEVWHLIITYFLDRINSIMEQLKIGNAQYNDNNISRQLLTDVDAGKL